MSGTCGKSDKPKSDDDLTYFSATEQGDEDTRSDFSGTEFGDADDDLNDFLSMGALDEDLTDYSATERGKEDPSDYTLTERSDGTEPANPSKGEKTHEKDSRKSPLTS